MEEFFLILGGAGYIGSHMVHLLVQNKKRVIVIDDLSSGCQERLPDDVEFIRADFSDKSVLENIFTKYTIVCVMHFAAFTQVDESVRNPKKYYHNNLIKSIALLEVLSGLGNQTIIFSSSAAIYGELSDQLIDENQPIQPKTPYGQTKAIFESVLGDYARAYSIQYACMRYFNACGLSNISGFSGFPTNVAHLIPSVIKVAIGEREVFQIYGDQYPTLDGTCVRDFVHVEDICRAHLSAFSYLQNGGHSTSFNIGAGVGYSVKQVLECVERVTEKKIRYVVCQPRPGDLSSVISTSVKLQNLTSWSPLHSDLDDIVRSVWVKECLRESSVPN